MTYGFGGYGAPGASGGDVRRVRELFEMHLEVGLHHGAQLTVYRGDEAVVDTAGGTAEPGGKPTSLGQKHVLFSCTKPYAAVSLHRLVDRGQAAYDDPVVKHWPAFADPDSVKAEATIRQVLSHQAGVPTSPIDDDPERWTDWDAAVDAMEAAEISFEPGATAAYHWLTFGFVVGELVRRISGTPIDEYARANLFEPLGMTDTYIGLPPDVPDDVAELVGFEAFDRCRYPGFGLSGVGTQQAADLFNREALHRAVVPSSTGVGTAHDLARFFACLANGGELDGTRILSPSAVAAATDVQAEVEADGTLGVPRRYALGFERAGTL